MRFSFGPRTARESVKKNTPIVVIKGTGMAANLIAYAWEFMHDTELVR